MPNQPPSKKPGLAILIGMGGPKPRSAPPSFPGDEKAPPSEEVGEQPDLGPQDQKVSPDEAQCFTSDYRCVSCEHYLHDSHECQKVEGNNFGTEIVGCRLYWEPEGEEESNENEPAMGEEVPDDGGGEPGGPAPGPTPRGQR